MNDSQIAKALGISHAAISHYKTGRRIMDDETCLAVALALQVNPMEVIGAACIDRAEKTGQKSLWEVFMSRTATAASVILTLAVALGGMGTSNNAEAVQLKTDPFRQESIS